MGRPPVRVVVVLSLIAVAAVVLAGCGGLLGQARTLDDKGDLAGAVALYKEIVAKSPNNLGALNGLAVDLLQLQRYDEALPVEVQVAALDSKDVQTRVELAFNYLNHQNQPAKAVEYLTQAAGLDPSAKNLTFLAQAQIVAGAASAAEQSLDKALKSDPKYPHTYVVLLSLLDSQGRAADAGNVREQARLNGVDLSQSSGS